MIKAIFFDIDGTLVSFQTHLVPPSTIEAIARLRENNIKVFIATGRRLKSINNLGLLEFDGYVTLNGGYCYAGKEEVIYRHSMHPQDIEALLRYQETDKRFPCAFVTDHEICMNYMDDAVHEVFSHLNFPFPPVKPIETISGQTIYQLLAFFGEDRECEVLSVMPHSESTRWNPLFTDIVPLGSSKRIGIDKMLAHFGLNVGECMAFGDGGNDISMLQHAGIGVAMGNAGEDVKNAADYVTDSVDDNGVLNALKHFGVI